MKVFSAETTINATPETIWRILTDSSQYTDWDPNMLTLEGNIAPGEQLTIYTKLAPNRAFKPKVVEFEPNRKMVWRSGMPLGLFKGTRTFLLEPQANSSTKFSTKEEFSGLLLPLFGATIPDLSQTFTEFVAALKARAESAI